MTSESTVTERPVLYVLKRFPRLSETFILRELLGLEAAGDRVVVASLLPPEAGPRHRELDLLRAEVHRIGKRPRLRERGVMFSHLAVAARRPLAWARTAARARRLGTWTRFVQAGVVADLARRTGARHLHAHFVTAATEVARDAAALSGLPVTVTAHAKDIFHVDNAPKLRTRLDGVDTVVTISEHNARHLDVHAPGVRVRCIPNGMSLEPPVPPRPDGPVLCVARLVPKKGIDTLVRAVARLATEAPAARVEIVGDGPLRADLEALAADLGVLKRVHFAGALDSSGVMDAYTRCSMVVLPCRVDADGDRDGLPTVLLEAMARGLPVISTDIVGIPELIEDGRSGLLVPPDDPAALAGAILRLLHEPALAASLGTQGRHTIATTHDPETTVRMLRDTFRSTGRGR